MKLSKFLFFILLIISSVSFLNCAATSNKGMEQYVGRAIIDVPQHYKPEEVVDNIYDSIAWRSSDLQKFETFLPEELPDKPAKPIIAYKEFGFGPYSFTFTTVKCGNKVWVSMNGQENELKSPYGTKESGGYRVCIYPYKNGYKVYVFGLYTYSEQNPFGGLIAKGIEKVVNKSLCNDDKTFNCWFKQIVDKIKNKFPDAKIARIDLPQH